MPPDPADRSTAELFDELGLAVLERGWLSSNNVLFAETCDTPATVVDTGYASHSEQSVALLRASLGPVPLGRVLNTHLHSDHCGGNAAIQAAWRCEVWVPQASFEAVRDWDEQRLSHRYTGQRCDRFQVAGAVAPGETVILGHRPWQAVAAPGHDPEALMFWEPASRVLITADALWLDRVAIIFPELAGEPGFAASRSALDAIEKLGPCVVIPGHGSPFTDVEGALARSRRRLDQFESDPVRHFDYSTRALTMFHMLEHRALTREDLVGWLLATPVFAAAHARIASSGQSSFGTFATRTVDRLVSDGHLRIGAGDEISLAVD